MRSFASSISEIQDGYPISRLFSAHLRCPYVSVEVRWSYILEKANKCVHVFAVHLQHGFVFPSGIYTLLSMTLLKCPGCKRKYHNGSSLSAHQRGCAALEAKTKERLKKRVRNRKKREIAKITRQGYSQENTDPLELRPNAHEHIYSLDAEEDDRGKRRQDMVSNFLILKTEDIFDNIYY